MQKPSLSAQQKQSNTQPTTAATLNTSKTAQAKSAGEFIYSTMIPPSTTADKHLETTETFSSTNKPSNKSHHMMSMDLKLRSSDFGLSSAGHQGNVLLSNNVNAKPMPITSSDFVAQHLLMTKEEPLKFQPRPRPLKLERITTGDSILKGGLDLHDGRLSSGDWKMEDFRDESSLAMKQLLEKQKPNVGSLCYGMQRMSTDDGMDLEGCSTPTPSRTPAVRLPSDMSADWVGDFSREQASSMGPIRPSLFDEKENSERKLLGGGLRQAAATSSTKPTTKTVTPTQKKTTKKKKKPKRIIDMGNPCDPTDDDVLFGRGGYTNSHPGNIRFREKALEFRPLYEKSSKEEKYEISQMLLDSVTSEGARFLEKGKDGNWYQVIGNGARKKASQALRERIKGTPRRKGAAKKNLASSVTSSNSHSSDQAEAYFAQEINGDTGDVYAV